MPDGTSFELYNDIVPTRIAHDCPLTSPLEGCFEWVSFIQRLKRILPSDENHRYYVVAFRSIRNSTADNNKLYSADAAAQLEAQESGGLLTYWYGTLNERRECLAMCIWQSREHAVKALQLPAHAAAMYLAREMYDTYTLERYWLTTTLQGMPELELIGSVGVRQAMSPYQQPPVFGILSENLKLQS